jgi:hypothetical protein
MTAGRNWQPSQGIRYAENLHEDFCEKVRTLVETV